MPNHITNILTINGDNPEEVLTAIKGDSDPDEFIDFNKIIPQPDDLHMGNVSMEDRERTKGHNWYDWNCENWGTKWGAYSQDLEGNVLRFDTAWSMPLPVIVALSAMFPDREFHLRWADEDFGCNTGIMLLKGGEITEGGALDNSSPAAYKNAVDINYGGELPDYYRWLADGTAEYIDEDEDEDY
jgi:hypothetical protein